MSGRPTAAAMVSEGVSRICDLTGVVLLIVLGWRMFFVFDSALQAPALVVGLIGMAASWTDRNTFRNAPLPMVAYVGIALLSAAVHQWATVSAAAEPAWLSLFAPAFHLVVMAVFIYGTAHLLRTSSRVSWFVVLLVASIGVLAVQIAFDRASTGFVYVRAGPTSASVPHWGGIHGTSLLLTLAFPIVAAAMLSGREVSRVMAGVVLASGLLVVAYLNGSRGGLVAMVFLIAAMAVFALIRQTRIIRQPLILGGIFIGLATGLAAAVWLLRRFLDHRGDFSGRTLIWKATASLVLDHPWLGVGPGNYSRAIVDSGQAKEFFLQYGALHNAHNLMLHSGAEVGVVGALCLVLFLAWALTAGWRSWASGSLPLVSLGLVFALGGFLVHSLSENFLDARAEVERTRLVVWMVLAVVLALERLARRTAAEPVRGRF